MVALELLRERMFRIWCLRAPFGERCKLGDEVIAEKGTGYTNPYKHSMFEQGVIKIQREQYGALSAYAHNRVASCVRNPRTCALQEGAKLSQEYSLSFQGF